MKSRFAGKSRQVALGVALLTALTACLPSPPPPYPTGLTLNFQFPETTVSQNLKLAAIYFEAPEVAGGNAVRKVLTVNPLSYSPGPKVKQASLMVYNLTSLENNARCVTPFLGGESQGMQAVTVTPSDVKTCNLYFTLFNDADGDNAPQSSEELYTTHTLYGYATSDFTYSMTSPDGKSVETGTRVKGWSLVRHQVLEPSATPGRYRVTMNSAPTADVSLPIRLHEPTNRLISQSLGGQP